MKVKIIKKEDNQSLEYSIDEIFEVESSWYGGVNVKSKTGIPLSLSKEEYEILSNEEENEKTKKSLKVLMLNGSSNKNGCTNTALNIIGEVLKKEGIDYEIFQIGATPIRDCIGCKRCNENGCIFDDDNVNQFIEKAKKSDGFIFGTPVYYSHPSGRILSFLDRAFYSSKKVFSHKPASAIVSARRAGTSSSLDVLNKYFSISSMPVISSTYWNIVHGNTAEEVMKDKEGIQTMKNLGKNMAWILKSIQYGKENGLDIPTEEINEKTNFIR